MTLFLTLLSMAMGGCNLLEYPAYVLFATQNQTVKAEYPGLKNTTTAIVVAAGPGIDFEYPDARMNLMLAGQYMISEQLPSVEFVSAERVDRFQREDVSWLSLPMAEIGQRFGADRILYIDLYSFTTYEENSINLLRGRIEADVRVYDMTDRQPNRPVYRTDITVVWPEQIPVPVSDPATMLQLERRTITLFADELAKRFYDHKIPLDEQKKKR